MFPLFVRSIKFLIGLGFVGVLMLALLGTVSGLFTDPPQPTAEEEFHHHPKDIAFASDGPFGKFDKAQLQRGFQVFKEVCAACHSLNLASFRELGGIGYNEAEIKAIAEQWPIEQPSVNPETGEAATRKNLPSDRFPSPYPNEVAARAANNNAVPPDLTLMTKARHDGGAYVYSLLTGYHEPDPELLRKFPASAPGTGLYHNPYFAALNIAMPPPLSARDQVAYAEGAPAATVPQMAKDVSAFLIWTAEPHMESRKTAGFAVVLFLLITTFLAFGAYLTVWRGVKH